MQLEMFLGNDLVATSQINFIRLGTPGYINQLKMEMEDKYEDVIDLSGKEPDFVIDSFPSSMNGYQKKRELN
jgi:hypothetical protein